jgi:HD-like signal output (HDOD) protein
VLGSRVLSSLVAGFALRSSINGPVRLDRFWDSSIRVAQLAARLTKEFRGVAADHAYTFGLFHDCGIAVLLQRFPDYRDTLQLANADGAAASPKWKRPAMPPTTQPSVAF